VDAVDVMVMVGPVQGAPPVGAGHGALFVVVVVVLVVRGTVSRLKLGALNRETINPPPGTKSTQRWRPRIYVALGTEEFTTTGSVLDFEGTASLPVCAEDESGVAAAWGASPAFALDGDSPAA
jgi:hypothetical protein